MDLTDADMLEGLRACNYSAMAALTFTLWDIIITVPEEVVRIWKGHWTRLKSLYLFLRFFPLGVQIVSAVISMKLEDIPRAPLRLCIALAAFQGISSELIVICVQVILILRVQALYHRNALLRRALRALFLAEITTMTLLFTISMPNMKYGAHCVIVDFPSKTAPAFFLSPIIFEFTLFTLTMLKFYQAVREGWGKEPAIARFLKDGIWVFALPFSILTINTWCMAFLTGPYSSIAYSWAVAIPGFAGYRLILNMSHLLKSSRRRVEPTDTDITGEVVFDTILSFNY